MPDLLFVVRRFPGICPPRNMRRIVRISFRTLSHLPHLSPRSSPSHLSPRPPFRTFSYLPHFAPSAPSAPPAALQTLTGALQPPTGAHGCDNQPPIAGWLSQPCDRRR